MLTSPLRNIYRIRGRAVVVGVRENAEFPKKMSKKCILNAKVYVLIPMLNIAFTVFTGNPSPTTGPAKIINRACCRVGLEFPPQRSNLNLQGQLQGFSGVNPQSFFIRHKN